MTTELKLPYDPEGLGVKLVETPTYRRIRNAVRIGAKDKCFIAIDGGPGNGKTFAAIAAALSVHRAMYWLPLTGELSLTSMYKRLLSQITGDKIGDLHTKQMGDEIKELLSSHDCWLFIDEGQWTDLDLLRVIRSIYDETTSLFGLVMLGYDLDPTLYKEKGLNNRITARVSVHELSPREVVKYIVLDYHPMFGRMSPSELYTIWLHCGGNFRQWENFVRITVRMGYADNPTFTKNDVADVLDFIGKTPMHTRVKAQEKEFGVTIDEALAAADADPQAADAQVPETEGQEVAV